MLALVGYCIVIAVATVWLFAHTKSKAKADLENKIVLITGASSGVGRASCFAFCRHKCRLILCSRRDEELKKLREELITYAAEECGFELEVQLLPLDITQRDKLAPAIDHLLLSCDRRVDILLNNAGISFRGRFEDTELSVFDRVMQVNFMGQLALTKAVLPYMLNAGEGHIVGVGSVQVCRDHLF